MVRNQPLETSESNLDRNVKNDQQLFDPSGFSPTHSRLGAVGQSLMTFTINSNQIGRKPVHVIGFKFVTRFDNAPTGCFGCVCSMSMPRPNEVPRDQSKVNVVLQSPHDFYHVYNQNGQNPVLVISET